MTGARSILKKIFDSKRRRVEELRERTDLARLAGSAAEVSETAEHFRFSSALERKDRVNIIAEFKRASPSKGVIDGKADPSIRAAEYERSGAAAISVLTEEDHFLGSIADLKAVRKSVSLPVLRKDFLFDPFQVYEARAAGADAILFILAMLDDGEIAELMGLAASLGLDALLEVHTEEEMRRASGLGARLIGVNNRDLNTFEVSLDRSRALCALRPGDALMISESGIGSADQILELRELGYDAFLIGEALMRTESPGNWLWDQMNSSRRITA